MNFLLTAQINNKLEMSTLLSVSELSSKSKFAENIVIPNENNDATYSNARMKGARLQVKDQSSVSSTK